MRTIPVSRSPRKTFPTVYRAWWFDQPGMLARINGVITFRSDEGVVSEHTQADMRYMVCEHVVDELAQQRMEYDVAMWRGQQAPAEQIAA